MTPKVRDRQTAEMIARDIYSKLGSGDNLETIADIYDDSEYEDNTGGGIQRLKIFVGTWNVIAIHDAVYLNLASDPDEESELIYCL